MDAARPVVSVNIAPSASMRVAASKVWNALTLRRAGIVLALCLILSTQVLAQAHLFQQWSIERIVEGWSYYFAEMTVTGFAMLGGFVLAEGFSEGHGLRRAIALGIAIPTSAAIGYALVVSILYPGQFSVYSLQFVGDTLRMSVIGGTVALIHLLRERSDAAATATHETQVAQQALAQQTLEARLQLMEAQIEPHFIFNSIANVQRLFETEPESGERLLENLKTYMRAALRQMRETGATLGRETELCRAYLEVLRARMDERLRFTIDVPAELENHAFPPMMVITLVENAIKHGIGGSPIGGLVSVRACRNGERLRVEVADTGGGFRGSSGTGIGLANTRARLAALFGDRAELALWSNEPSGVVASIEIPSGSRAHA
jgi:sensor histidine kinase YesM